MSTIDALTGNTLILKNYKDLESQTCGLTCPDGQFISPMVSNICVYCI